LSWLLLKIQANDDNAELISDSLMELGALSASIEDTNADTESEQAIFGEPGDPPPGIWHQNTVTAMFESDADVEQLISQLSERTEIESFDYSTETIEEQDWVRETQAQFNPIKITEQLWIVPTWHDAPNRDAINIILDPGLAFGTGSHPTTHLCLEWLTQQSPLNNVLDYGCGSGILAIAAKKLGADNVTGVDIDPQAITASRYNAENNQAEVEFYDSADFLHDEYDVVVANILSSALMVLAPVIAKSTKAGGKIALSGILEEQQDTLVDQYSEWFEMDAPIVKDGWVLLTGTKKSTSFITSCPECDTQFIVKDEQLRAYSGQVRCGDCNHVFNALENIVQEHKPIATTENKIFSVLESVSLGGDTITEEYAASTTEDDDTADSEIIIEPPAAETATETLQLNAPDLINDLNVNSKFEIKRAKKPFSWLLFSLCSILLILLVGQLTYSLRTEISAYYPKTTPWLKLACAKIGCKVELPKKITLITIDDSDMHENTSYHDVLQFSSTLVNHANFVQAYPLVELTLTDIDDKPVLRRTFAASDYLPKDIKTELGIAANEEVRIKINLSSSDIPVAGYRVTVKY
jgi:ribosomal protein L11 methyltransferase